MKRMILLLLLAFLSVFLLTGCTDESKTKYVLEQKGYSDIRITGYNFLDCSNDDFYATGFVAVNNAGREEKGTLCCGLLFKGCTIRN